jgi:hypothetical protein
MEVPMYHNAKPNGSLIVAAYVLAVAIAACDRRLVTDVRKSGGVNAGPSATGNSTTRMQRGVPEVPTISDRFASLVPEFAGAYRGRGGLVVRVTDLALPRSGGADSARALLNRELSAYGRGDLVVSFELARYEYRRLKEWLETGLDSLGSYRAVSWSIDQRTSQIRVGFLDAASQSGFRAALAKLGVPSDAIVTSLDSADHVRDNVGR